MYHTLVVHNRDCLYFCVYTNRTHTKSSLKSSSTCLTSEFGWRTDWLPSLKQKEACISWFWNSWNLPCITQHFLKSIIGDFRSTAQEHITLNFWNIIASCLSTEKFTHCIGWKYIKSAYPSDKVRLWSIFMWKYECEHPFRGRFGLCRFT